MTNPPRYPTDRPDHTQAPSPYGGQPYPGTQTHVPSDLRYDWRYAQQPHDPYDAAQQPITAPIPKPKKSRRGAVVAGSVAVAAAMVGGGIGAATMLANERANDTTTIKSPVAQAPLTPQPTGPRAQWNRSRPR